MASSLGAGTRAGKVGTRRPLIAAAGMLLVASSLIASPALASHPEVSLAGSNFEIDTDANLKVDDPAPSIDWANVAETRKADKASGSGDDSFGQGTKEDTAVPQVVDGSIPPNKSDLLNFGVYLEDNPTGTDFLHLFWHRVQEPSGTTNMDFEFNKSLTPSANGVTPVRTAGDVLIQYDLSQGGTNPVLFVSRWVTTGATSQCEASNSLPCWSDKQNLTAAGDATGSINTTAIPAADSDGLTTAPNVISPRTFGEASVDFTALGGGTDPCVSFGSAYLKSRSSDSFTSALKDFIAPTPLNLANCGAIKVTKTRKHAADGAGPHPHAGVTFTLNGGTPKVTDANGQVCWDALQFGSYTVTETLPTGYVADGPLAKTVVVDNVATCAGSPYAGESVSFSNTPLTNLSVSIDSQIAGGTASTVVCTQSGGGTVASGSTGAGGDGTVSATNLQPGTYTCTIVIDP
jgi:hypothetical protein